MRIPPHVILLDAIGALAAGLGLWGALAGGGTVLPFLANRASHGRSSRSGCC